jgi:hypothetical protein
MERGNMELKAETIQKIIELTNEVYTPSMKATTADRFKKKRLTEYIQDLPQKERAELVAVMWLGRGDGGETVEDWKGLVAKALEEKAYDDIEYIVNKQPLAKYLSDGLRKLNART